MALLWPGSGAAAPWLARGDAWMRRHAVTIVPMSFLVSELLSAVPFVGLLYAVWLLWGRAARRAGMGRLQLLGLSVLLGKLMG